MVVPPPLTPVHPGDPISSEGWNNVLTAIGQLVAHANQRRGTLTVKVLGPGNLPFRGATVTAQPTGEPPRPARAGAFVGGEVNAYQFEELLPGAYAIVVEADGFTVSSTQSKVEMGAAVDPEPLVFQLAEPQVRVQVPALLGLRLGDALALLAPSLDPGRIIDSHGIELVLAEIGDETKSIVLGQFPFAGELQPKGTDVFLHISATSEVLKRVKVPELRGLSLTAAKAAIEAAGLDVGDVNTLGATTPTTPPINPSVPADR
jgi:hypothetical protein